MSRRVSCLVSCCGSLALILGAAVPLNTSAAAVAAVNHECNVKNVTQGTPARTSLQRAINDASSYDVLRVRGHCVGTYRIDKNLQLKGSDLGDFSRPLMDADHDGSVLRIIGRGTYVGIEDVILHGGGGIRSGGGIHNEGHVILKGDTRISQNHAYMGGGIFNKPEADVSIGRDVIIRRNSAHFGGGIYARHHAPIYDRGEIRANRAAFGAGIYIWSARLYTYGHAQISGNDARGGGGGLMILGHARVDISHATHLKKNTARRGGGVYNEGRKFFLGQHAKVVSNSAQSFGGGIYNKSTFIAQGSARVTRNSTDTGAGIFNSRGGDVALAGDARVKANIAHTEGGGIYNKGTVTVTDTAKVTANVPDDCVGC